MDCSPLTALIAICLMQCRQLSAADLIGLSKNLFILDGGPKGEGSLSFLQPSLPFLSRSKLNGYFFTTLQTNALISNCSVASGMNTECDKYPDRQMSFLKYRIQFVIWKRK